MIYTEAQNTPLSALKFFSAFSSGLKDIVFKIKWGQLNEWKYLNCGTYLYLGIYIYKTRLCSKENIKSFVSSFFGDPDWFFHKTSIIFSLMYHSLLNSMVILVCKDYLTRGRIFKCTQQMYLTLTEVRRKTPIL